MSRILIDLTDLESWSGHHGGTQRVVYGISKYFYLYQELLEYEVSFITFSSSGKLYKFTDFAPIYERAEAAKKDTGTAAGKASETSLRRRLKYYAGRYVPESIRKNKQARKLAKQSFRIAQSSVKKAKSIAAQRPHLSGRAANLGAVTFRTDDIVLILGKPWDNLDIQKTLASEKLRTNFKLVQVVYDLVIPLHPHLHHPSLFVPYTQNLFEAISISDLLLPISQSSARDLERFCKQLNLREPVVKVIRLGDDVVDRIDRTTPENYKPDSRIADQFIACVGTIEIRKNHTLLYYTYKLAKEQGVSLPQLVIVGARGWLTDDIQYLIEHDPAIKEKIIIIDNANDAALDWIYRNCLFTVYPSMYEGWGLPVAESLAYGKMCVASNASSIPEVAGDLIDYFSPYDVEGCLRAIHKYQNNELLHKREQVIMKQYKIQSWEGTFRQILSSIKS